MRKELLKILRCPVCKNELIIEIYEYREDIKDDIWGGLLTCKCGSRFPIWKGVPRMFRPEIGIPKEFFDNYQDYLKSNNSIPKIINKNIFSFSIQWEMFKLGELTWELDLETRVEYFYHYINSKKGNFKDKLILDAGCGNGTLSAALAASRQTVIAMDYSNSVEQAELNKKQFSGNNWQKIHYIQGDVQNPPFSNNSIDVIYSDGVLHHTDNTKKSFLALVPLVKDSGRLFVWLYRKDLIGIYKLKELSVDLIRLLIHPFPYKIIIILCYIGALILLTWLKIKRFLGFKTRPIIPIWLKTLNLFDTFSPQYYHRHTPNEVKTWYNEMGFSNIKETTIYPELGHSGFGILGVKE